MPSAARRLAVTLAGFGALTLAALPARRRSSAARTIQLVARSSIGRSRSPTTSTRRSSSSRGCRACWRRRSSARARARRRRLPGAAAQPAGVAGHARRLGRRRARRDAGDHVPRRLLVARHLRRCRSPASPARSARSASSTRCRRRGGAARRRSCCCWPASTLHALLLGARSCSCSTSPTSPRRSGRVRWLMGSLDVGSYAPIVAALVPMALAFVGFATLPRVLDLISLGAEAAAARGVDVRARRARRARQRVAGDRRGGVARRAGRASSASSCRTSSG